MSLDLLIPAAQYLRMSTDEQKLSLVYQATTIERYALKARVHRIEYISRQWQEWLNSETTKRFDAIVARYRRSS
jgi:hypothetical protein